MKERVGIVVVTYNSEAFIASCLSSLQGQDFVEEIVVVDNNSSDHTVEVLEKNKKITIIKNRINKGFAKAVNQGTKKLLKEKCTHILWINPDTSADEDMVAHLLNGMKQHKADIVQPSILLPDMKTINTLGNELTFFGVSYCKDFGKKLKEKQKDTQITIASGACMLVKAELFEEIGYLDETFFMYQEDTDFSWRAQLADKKIYHIADACCYHDYSLKLPGRKMYWLERNRLKMLLQNYSAHTLLLLLPIGVFLECGLLTYSLLNGWIHWKILSYIHVLFYLPHIYRQRRKVQRLRVKTDKEIATKMAASFGLRETKILPVRFIINPILQAYFFLVKRFF